MVTLKAATYQVTTTFKDNVYAEGLEELQEYGLAIMLYGYSDKDPWKWTPPRPPAR